MSRGTKGQMSLNCTGFSFSHEFLFKVRRSPPKGKNLLIKNCLHIWKNSKNASWSGYWTWACWVKVRCGRQIFFIISIYYFHFVTKGFWKNFTFEEVTNFHSELCQGSLVRHKTNTWFFTHIHEKQCLSSFGTGVMIHLVSLSLIYWLNNSTPQRNIFFTTAERFFCINATFPNSN